VGVLAWLSVWSEVHHLSLQQNPEAF